MKNAIILMVILVVLACPAWTDYAIFTPTGTTLGAGQFRAEVAAGANSDNGKYYWLGMGLMQCELNLISRAPEKGSSQNSFGAQIAFLPETFATPAVGFGVMGISSQTHRDVSGYAAITKTLPVGALGPLSDDVKATLGLALGGTNGLFGSVEASLPFGFFLQGEYDTRSINAAFGWRVAKIVRLKAYTINNDIFAGIELNTIRF